VVLATVTLSPAFAQSYDPSIGSGNLNNVPYYRGDQTPRWSSPYYAYAKTRHPGKAHRSPYAQYDSEGNLIDENMPGRW
jgi:hypothetical protein